MRVWPMMNPERFFGYTYFSEVHPENVLYAGMCIKYVQSALLKVKVRLMVRTGASVDREPVFLTAVIISVQINVARNAFRAATAISQYTTLVQLNLLWASSFVALWQFDEIYRPKL